MNDMPSAAEQFRLAFGPFCLIPGERLLTKDGVPVNIGGRSLDLLIALVEERGRVVLKRDLLKRVWPDVVVEDGSLRFHMAGLRRALGDGNEGARYITTQVGMGYAFVAPVRQQRISREAPVPVSMPETWTEQRQVFHAAPTARLPTKLSRVFGRDHDVQLITDRSVSTQLFTIVGPAGVGKTTLAVESGHRLFNHFAEKVNFVDLGTLQDPALIPSAIAASLGISVPGEDTMTVVLRHIHSERLLLILDNCEHLIDPVSAIVEQIMDVAQDVHLLATSREPLRVRGEHVHQLGSLDYPIETEELSREQILSYPAVELFVERATAGNSTLEIDVEAARSIAEMCRKLDGMALPIELTAVRVATYGLDATARLLGERFSLGWRGRRTALPRQQTLQATLDWSYDLLSDAERRTLERLSVFLGPFSVEAALDVALDETIDTTAAVSTLDELAAKSLLSPDRSGDASNYRLLEMTRTYASEKLRARGKDDADHTARRHAAFFLRQLEMYTPIANDRYDDVVRFSSQLGNIRSALEWSFGPAGDISIAVPLAAASARIFLALSHLVECRTWCDRGVARLEAEDTCQSTTVELELQASLGLSLMFTRGNSEAAETALKRALEISVALGDKWNELRILGRLHIFHERIGDFKTSRGWADSAVQVADEIGDPEAIGVAASLAGISYHLGGDQQLARRELELSLKQSPPSDRRRTAYYGFDHRNRSAIALARTLWLQGHADQARRVGEQAVREAAGLEHPVTHCIALIWLLSVYVWSGDHEKAETSLATFAGLAELNALGPYISASRGFRGELSVHQGKTQEALAWLEESLTQLRTNRYELLTTAFSIAQARGLFLDKRFDEALTVVDGAIDHCNGSGEQLAMPELLRLKAKILWSAGGNRQDVESLLLDSLACSRRQGACGWELRTAVDLAGLWKAGRQADAITLLGAVRETFPEGLETPDLKKADQLLKALGGFGGDGAAGGRPRQGPRSLVLVSQDNC
jgi:predicted ATPase/DNA-binding winged helix-turn-helix (wHTH) protein